MKDIKSIITDHIYNKFVSKIYIYSESISDNSLFSEWYYHNLGMCFIIEALNSEKVMRNIYKELIK